MTTENFGTVLVILGFYFVVYLRESWGNIRALYSQL